MASQPIPPVGAGKDGSTVVLRLNRQQLELLDRTIARGVAADRPALVRRALREYAAARASSAAGSGT